ncbi:Peptidoglycan glycosyltransferase [Leadbetterella byssophila DSM 17132]|uniref:Peptidoglycan glycosyltransferase n=1 Tax=Leadbetterella byssophila (strain DSM 17132 / JCM 16389 / KACC 11308 / NBRC 106382 / 4M15) TaxID=649349 RepID=E4RZQ9_LEAB4|nr:penicillin-binding protein 2 [Leadbetterella byssophila]ADQ18302.1 Peptidoglycan glycosyltransferase [Leadbetterella byssophila DSM 17132]
MSNSKIKDTFILRSWKVWGGLCVLAALIVFKIVQFQTTKKEELINLVKDTQMKERVIDAQRGNIYAADGVSILATSTPEYRMVLDPSVAKPEVFKENITPLAEKLSAYFKDKSAAAYKEKILNARKAGLRYIVINNKRLTYKEKSYLESFPLYDIGSVKGGGFFEESERRFHPFNTLAERTIGNLDKKDKKKGATGLEAEFDAYLRGIDGKGFYERLPGGYMKPVDLESDIASVPGQDIVTTLDVNFQDIAESALRAQVEKTQAKYGSVVLMEIETGEVKAIANLTRHTDSNGRIFFSDDINYAVTRGGDPGSTFKLASMLAILEKSNLKPDDFAVECKGSIRHKNVSFTCSHSHGELTVQQVFEKSCNIGIYALMKRTFGFGKSDEFYNYLKKFRLDQQTNFQLKGEPAPLIKSSSSKTFSGTTIPWMSIGYETRITPIQMLTFYNAVANNGYWVQPLLVKEIRAGNVTIQNLKAKKASDSFASKRSIEYVQQMMRGVVQNGTAKNIHYGECTTAGKTGTAQKRVEGAYQRGTYYTSFIGYFPANKPRYTAIVVIDEPIGQNVYGGDVCAPVFKTIADKIYAYDMGMHRTLVLKSEADKAASQIALSKATDQAAIARKLNFVKRPTGDGWLKPTVVKRDSVAWKEEKVEELSHLIGMTLRDALPILENKNYIVRYSGFGRISEVRNEGKVVNLVLR